MTEDTLTPVEQLEMPAFDFADPKIAVNPQAA